MSVGTLVVKGLNKLQICKFNRTKRSTSGILYPEGSPCEMQSNPVNTGLFHGVKVPYAQE